MTSPTDTPLLPCPCGAPAQMNQILQAQFPSPPLFGVVCTTPACFNGPWRNTEKEAAEAWNRRAVVRPAPAEGVDEGLVERLLDEAAELERVVPGRSHARVSLLREAAAALSRLPEPTADAPKT